MPVGDWFFVKFAWSRPAALQLAHEIGVLAALAREPAVPFLPEVVASSTNPLLLITRRVPGASLFDVVDSIDRDRAALQLVRFLAALYHPATRQRIEAAVGRLTGAQLPPTVTTATSAGRHLEPVTSQPAGALAAGFSRYGRTRVVLAARTADLHGCGNFGVHRIGHADRVVLAGRGVRRG